MSQARVPAWITVVLLPAINILMAFLVSAILFYYLDINPLEAATIMWQGAFSSGEGIGFTLYYATGFIFTGLAVAVAFHAGLFNIGGEGQAYIGGLGVGLVCLFLGDTLPFVVLLPLAILVGGLFGAAWAFIPAWLQAKRGSHIFNGFALPDQLSECFKLVCRVHLLTQHVFSDRHKQGIFFIVKIACY